LKSSLSILCIAVLCIILSLGLWPFHAPRNDVTWLKDRDGLRFGNYATVMSTGAFPADQSSQPRSCSVEMCLQAARAGNEGTVLTLYVPKQPVVLSLRQSLGDLELRSGKDRRHRFYVNNVFRPGRPAFVTVTSGAQGTAVYVNGALLRTVRAFQFAPVACAGRLIVGDSPLQQDPWSGQLWGLAIYASELPAQAVLQHYRAWAHGGKPQADAHQYMAGLYLFDERAGAIVHNHARPGLDLSIPSTYYVQDKIFLEPFWDEFAVSWSYVKGILKNIVGFVPLGFCFCAYFELIWKTRRAVLVTVVLGGAVSLTIEVLQGFLPTRDSGTTDLITNTFGTWIGVVLYHAASARLPLHLLTPEN